MRAGRENCWLVASSDAGDIVALRCGIGATIEGEPEIRIVDDAWVCDWRTALGALRLKIAFPEAASLAVRCTTSFLPVRDAGFTPMRDLFGAEGCTGKVHTAQRGLRTGIFYASYATPRRADVLYLQNFSQLTDLFEATQSTPADTVGGSLEEGGFLAPLQADKPLPDSREFVISDAFVAAVPDSVSDDMIAARYFDLLADIYLAMDRPEVSYHDWADRAARTMRDICLSPACTYSRGGNRYVMPYVNDTSKPPESMVQLTVLVNALEYERWRGSRGPLTATLARGIPAFYDPAIGSLVRWLPGEDFGEQSEEHMDHETMDSWYLYHS
ncbi:MAG TPA: hypothetical protein VGF18_00390, partial [Candidatus Tumulicola sp.]